VAPDFNRLTVFDARFPHGVRVVEGVSDPRAARLVLHGWFLDPRPFFEGGLDEEAATDALNAALDPLYAELAELAPVRGHSRALRRACADACACAQAAGVLTVLLRVRGRDGALEGLEALSDTLVPHPGCGDPAEARREVLCAVRRHLQTAVFPTAASDTRITLPFIFE
jgi:hypothetical protein